jgi:hypothetical protein
MPRQLFFLSSQLQKRLERMHLERLEGGLPRHFKVTCYLCNTKLKNKI